MKLMVKNCPLFKMECKKGRNRAKSRKAPICFFTHFLLSVCLSVSQFNSSPLVGYSRLFVLQTTIEFC